MVLFRRGFGPKKEKKYRSEHLVGIPRNFFFDEKKFPNSTDQVSRSVFHFRFCPKMVPKLSHLDLKKIWGDSLIFSLQPCVKKGYPQRANFGEKGL